jgi:protein-disulfide isomerase
VKRNLFVIAVAALLVVAFAIGMHFADQRKRGEAEAVAQSSQAELVREHSPSMGSDDARVTIVEWFDPACETCAVFYPIVKSMLREHPDQLRLVVRYMPLHAGSIDVVRILEAARLQGKFWEALEVGYANQAAWAINHHADPQLFWQSIGGVGLSADQVSADMQNPVVMSNIERDVLDGQQLGVDKTPGFFVNGRPLSPFGEASLRRLVDEELARAYGR